VIFFAYAMTHAQRKICGFRTVNVIFRLAADLSRGGAGGGLRARESKILIMVSDTENFFTKRSSKNPGTRVELVRRWKEQ
jgi:hypothetical protein